MIKQKGFTLVEVMVGMTIGLIVLAGVLNFFSSIIHANAEAVKQQQFEQTVHVMVNTIAADIRRAGYTPLGKTVPSLTIGGNNVGSFYTNDNCLLLTYRNPDSSIAYRGYLRDAATKAIYVLKNELTAPSSCSKSDPAWNATPVTDPSLLTVEAPSSPISFIPGRTGKCGFSNGCGLQQVEVDPFYFEINQSENTEWQCGYP